MSSLAVWYWLGLKSIALSFMVKLGYVWSHFLSYARITFYWKGHTHIRHEGFNLHCEMGFYSIISCIFNQLKIKIDFNWNSIVIVIEYLCNQYFQEKKVKKLYLALASSPLPTGIITHYMRPINMAPRLISEGNHMSLSD